MWTEMPSFSNLKKKILQLFFKSSTEPVLFSFCSEYFCIVARRNPYRLAKPPHFKQVLGPKLHVGSHSPNLNFIQLQLTCLVKTKPFTKCVSGPNISKNTPLHDLTWVFKCSPLLGRGALFGVQIQSLRDLLQVSLFCFELEFITKEEQCIVGVEL